MWCPPWAFWAHSILTNDIAVIQLDRPVHMSSKIQVLVTLPHCYVCDLQAINMAGATPPPGTEAWVGGWGLDGVRPSEVGMARSTH